MAWAHPIATIIEDASDEQRFRASPVGIVIVELGIQLGLDRLKQLSIDNGGLLASQNLAFERDFTDVEAVAQQVREWSAGKRDAANALPALQLSGLCDNAPAAQISHQQIDASDLEIGTEN